EMDRGDVDAALRRLERLRDHIDASSPDISAGEYYLVLGEACRRKGLLPNAINAFRKSIDFRKRRMESLASERERAGDLKSIEKSFRGLVAATLASSSDPAESLRIWQSYRTLDAV